jgi:hypothetical protein
MKTKAITTLIHDSISTIKNSFETIEEAQQVIELLLSVGNETYYNQLRTVFFDLIDDLANNYQLIEALDNLGQLLNSHHILINEEIAVHLETIKNSANEDDLKAHAFAHRLNLKSEIEELVISEFNNCFEDQEVQNLGQNFSNVVID